MLIHAVGRYHAANIPVDAEEEESMDGSGDEGEPSGTEWNTEIIFSQVKKIMQWFWGHFKAETLSVFWENFY